MSSDKNSTRGEANASADYEKQSQLYYSFTNLIEINMNRRLNNVGSLILFVLLTAIFGLAFGYLIRDDFSFKELANRYTYIDGYSYSICILGLLFSILSGFLFLMFIYFFSNILWFFSILLAILNFTLTFIVVLLSGGSFILSGLIGLVIFAIPCGIIAYGLYKNREIFSVLSKATSIEFIRNFKIYTFIGFVLCLPTILFSRLSLMAFSVYIEDRSQFLEKSAAIFVGFYGIVLGLFLVYLLRFYIASVVLLSNRNKVKAEDEQVNCFTKSLYFASKALGTIIFASILTGLLQVLEIIVRLGNKSEHEGRTRSNGRSERFNVTSIIVMVLYFILGFIISLIKEFIELFNSYALIDVAATGNSYYNALVNSKVVLFDSNDYAILNLNYNATIYFIGLLFNLVPLGLLSYMTGKFYMFGNTFPIVETNAVVSTTMKSFFLYLPGFFLGLIFCVLYEIINSTLIYSSVALPGDLSVSYPNVMNSIADYNIRNYEKVS